MYYLVGLGNPGEDYSHTRHNIGFLALDSFIEAFNLPAPVSNSRLSGRVSEGVVGKAEVQILYPDTFMNNSGVSVKKVVPKEDVANLVVLYDDVALPLGEIKISFGRGDGGHNGIKSIAASLGTKDFIRMRIGVAPTSFWTRRIKTVNGGDRAKFVLGKFGRSEADLLKKEVLPKVTEVVVTILESGYVKAMNEFN
jgi:peptidyl-tRNA hydrolase, PTH1 family